MKHLATILFASVVLLTAGAAEPPKSPSDSMQPLSTERFAQVRSALKNLKYPVHRSVLLKSLGDSESAKWVFDAGGGKGKDVHHYSYFAVEPYVPGAGGFCVETELGKKGEEPTDEVIGARLCFVSRFGAIFYEKDGG